MIDAAAVIIGIVTAAASGGAAWGASKATLNGTRKRVERVETIVDRHVPETSVRLTRIETILDERLPPKHVVPS